MDTDSTSVSTKLTSKPRSLSPALNKSTLGPQRFRSLQEKKEAETQLKLLENRIQSLISQEARARKSIEQMEKRIQQLEATRERKIADLQKQTNLKEERLQAEHEIREKSNTTRAQIKKTIQKNQRNILKSRKLLARTIKSKISEHEETISKNNIEIKQSKQRNVLSYLNSRKNVKNEHDKFNQTMIQLRRKSFENEIQRQRDIEQRLQETIQRLNNAETDIIQRISHTVNMQEDAKKRLERVLSQSKPLR